MGGAAGHAGLFSTAREVVRLANEFLPGSRLLDDRWLRLFVDNLTPGRDGARSLGWVLASTADCSAGPALPATSMGHTGFTGTSLWIDPEQRRVFVLLTNRIHPVVRADDMRPIRQRFNTLSVEELEAQVSSV
jgi:CubicO group peptidase (beta-lactamase class C family)